MGDVSIFGFSYPAFTGIIVLVLSPKVSIVMPVFNVAPYLREAMDSILNQTYEDFEFIVLNDCSPDNSEEILNTYSDRRIVRYRGEKNVGFANILNVGIKMARGEFIARMDSDDISLPCRLEKQVAFLEDHPEIDLVSTGMQRFGESEKVLSHRTSFEDVKFDALSFSPVLHASSMWRRSKFLDHDLLYRQEMVPSEDYDLWTRALAQRLVLVNIPEVLYRYRTHDSQVTRVNRDWGKNIDVSYSYIKAIFPGISDESMKDFRSLMNIKDAERVKKVCNNLEHENSVVGYFDERYLHSKLKRYYQTRLFNQMIANGVKLESVFELRFPQLVKLLVHTIHDKCNHSTIQ